MIPVADPFMQGHEPPTRRPGDFYRDRFGTPHVSVADGHLVKPKRKADPPRVAMTRYSRPSNFGKIIEDMYSVTKWSERQEAFGFALVPELADRAKVLIDIEDRESQAWKDEADKIVKAAKLAAKADLAADRGTHTHGLAEDDDEDRDILARIEAGEELGLGEDVQRSLVGAWRDMLKRDGIEILAVEMPVVNDTYRAAGTLDRVARLTRALRFRLSTGEIVELPAGTVVILDIKTGKRRLRNNGTVMYWHSYAVQVFLYGPTSRPYDTDTDTRGEWQWEIDGKWALIAHLDVLGAIDGNPSCELILVDLEAGRRAADLCVAAKAWGNDDTVFSVAQIVEGEGAGCVGTRAVSGPAAPQGFDSPPAAVAPSPSTLWSAGMPDPSAPLTVGEEAGAAAGHSPAMPDDVYEVGDATRGIDVEWWRLLCDHCGHWVKGAVSKDDVAAWLRVHRDPRIMAGTPGVTCESTCPQPCEQPANILNPTVNDLIPRQGLPQHALDEIEVDRLNDQRRQSYSTSDTVTYSSNWPLAAPDRLALVDARGQLCATPDEGADLAEGFDELWDRLRTEFDALPAPAKTWRSELAQRAKQRGVSFMAQEGKTERRYHINRGLIALAIVDADDEILRALLALVLGDVAWFVGIEPGHLVGSLNHDEAAKFAALCDTYISPPPAA